MLRKPNFIDNPFKGQIIHVDYCELKTLYRLHDWIGRAIAWKEKSNE